jgi:predicted hydrolase (HD superfamily)
MITREQALQLIDKYVTTDWLKLHMIESEVIMRKLAKYLNENEEVWGISGLLHDLDYDYVNKDPNKHGDEIVKILEKENIELTEEVIHAIRAHNEHSSFIEEKRESKLDYALAASENLSGFLVACTLVQPDKKITSVKVDSVIKKLKTKAFAKAVNRELIYDIDKIGVPLEKFIELALEAMNEISEEIGL